MTHTRDEAFMRLALAQAQAAAAADEAPIGAILVDPETDLVVASAHNRPITLHDPTAHAEIDVLRKAGQMKGNYRLTGLELFVTLEPCAMCAGAISHARIGRLVYGASDAKGGAVEHGPRFFEQQTCHWKPDVVSGVLAQDCSEILREFFRAKRKHRVDRKSI
ncbi:tRNA adenosine(34) deaminase TadA [Maricaulis sp. D1M11]|uniref:tRNA adenosine(34) deaminase TadA n=1 Tax=Maricaulis sp. D1M11 TaxID=3076117 RepID=UPI0039B3C1A9